jgi:transposase-like protein
MKKQYRYYSVEYKQGIIAEIESGERRQSSVAREEGISSSLIDRWRQQERNGTLSGRITPQERQQAKDLDWYKKKVAEQALEIDLLKKIAAYSARMKKSNGCIVTERNVVRLKKDVG